MRASWATVTAQIPSESSQRGWRQAEHTLGADAESTSGADNIRKLNHERRAGASAALAA
jgi:hypothetical protein